jgi:hypothetical protein
MPSKSPAQHRLMEAVAHNPGFAKKVGIPTSVGKEFAKADKAKKFKEGGSSVNEAGNYTKPEMRKRLFDHIKGSAVQGTGAGEWSARKAQLLAKRYKDNGGGYRD